METPGAAPGLARRSPREGVTVETPGAGPGLARRSPREGVTVSTQRWEGLN